jgi:hypothetical protein
MENIQITLNGIPFLPLPGSELILFSHSINPLEPVKYPGFEFRLRDSDTLRQAMGITTNAPMNKALIPASLIAAGLLISEGECRLLKREEVEGHTNYILNYTPLTSSWGRPLQNLYLPDIMPSEVISYTETAILDSWSGASRNGTWPVISYGKWAQDTALAIEDLRPAFLWKDFLAAAISAAGYTLDTASMGGVPGWDNMMCPYFGTGFNVAIGATFDTRAIWDNSIPVAELLEDIIKCFNLCVQVDVVNRNIYIDTRDAFFNSGLPAIDISGRHDTNHGSSRDYYTTAYGPIISFQFNVNEDDAYSVLYAKSFHSPIGSADINMGGGFSGDMTILKLKHLATTAMIRDTRIEATGSAAPCLLPTIWRVAEALDNTRPAYSTDINPRILYYYNDPIYARFGSLNFSSSSGIIPVAATTAYAVYPDTTQADNLHFCNYNSKPGLAELYYKNTLRDVRQGYELNAIINLSAQDIAALNARALVWIRGLNNYFHIEEIAMDGNGNLSCRLCSITTPEPVVPAEISYILPDPYSFPDLV